MSMSVGGASGWGLQRVGWGGVWKAGVGWCLWLWVWRAGVGRAEIDKLCKNLSNYARICQIMQEFVKICKNLSNYARKC